MEKIIVSRMMYFLEVKGLMSVAQSGFRRGRSAMDAMNTHHLKEVMSVVYFDIEKAYDTMWREGLLIKLRALGIEGHLYNWIMDFLFD